MTTDQKYMHRCLQLAQKGALHAAPNPMVGAVIVHQNELIGEGYHQQHGGPHAEVHAVQSVKNTDRYKLKESTIYVSLEPCAHHGLTPPCAQLLIDEGIPKVVIASPDPFAQVNGKGVAMLQAAGITVEQGVMQQEADWLNRRFLTFHQQQRPYIILKWAQTANGYIAPLSGQRWITNQHFQLINHQWRAEEAAILVGHRTVLSDDPSLTVRAVDGPNPSRIVLDPESLIKRSAKVLNHEAPSIILHGGTSHKEGNTQFVAIDTKRSLLPQLMEVLYEQKLLSLIVEGGAFTLQSFIDAELWDEARIITADTQWNEGIEAPSWAGKHFKQLDLGNNQINYYTRE